jgi:hypothetical protein
VTSKSPVGDISVVTLIRTDTTLDHSQKAEKVWMTQNDAYSRIPTRMKIDELIYEQLASKTSARHADWEG